jgi:hypothetical protein
MEPARVVQRVFEAERMLNAAGQFARIAVNGHSLVRRTEMPPRQREITAVRDAGIFPRLRRPK